MTAPQATAPPAAAAMQGLKGFQRRTVDYAFRRLYLDADSTHRFLVADEVGLGKTMVARGVIAKAVEHLWNSVDRIDVVYVCSNADIARQNISRLRTDKDHSFARATRATMLPIELQDMAGRRVNYISMTPGTSLEPRGGTGIAAERALLLAMLRDHWEIPDRVGIRVFRGGVKSSNFRWWLKEWLPRYQIDAGLHGAFLKELDRMERETPKGVRSLRARFNGLAEGAGDDGDGVLAPRDDTRLFIAEMRAVLGRTCIRALRPDLVILDEFQRFKHLLDPGNEEAELARSLFEYADASEGRSEAARVLLLSATPYKMYSLQHEQDNGDADHYEDFVATYDFLVRHRREDNAALRALLRDYRGAVYRLGEGGTAELQAVKRSLQERLRLVMARTERLAVTNDRSGMLKEIDGAVRLDDGDVRQYLGAARIATELGHGEIVEYWKSAPYLLNFMDDYDLKRDLRAAVDRDDLAGLAAALAEHRSALLSWEDVQAYRRIDPANARLRSLLRDTVETGAWRLLWLRPSLLYYQLGGAFGGQGALATKRLVFSSWKVVPKVIAAVLSHEAERQMIALSHSDGQGVTIANSTDGRKRIAALLRFTRADNRLTGMPVLGLIYPSFSLAEAIDPAHGFGPATTPDEAAAAASRALAQSLRAVIDRWGGRGEVDERWYWAAPILLDRLGAPAASAAFWDRRKLPAEWSGDADGEDADGDVETDSVWSDHVQQARSVLAELAQGGRLGAAPDDLGAVLGKAAFGNPAVVALRSLARVTGASLRDDAVRLAAGSVAWRFRNLFNLPEVISLVRGLDGREPYWLRVIEYGLDGCLQAVLDEYAHVLRDSLGVSRDDPPQAAVSIAEEMARAVGLRAAAVGVDDIRAKPRAGRVTLAPQRMRSRFAARFGQQQSDDGADASRADQVRAAFNSPFWPFVLASTSVGQEGLDFHHYCHAIVHWNLPSNPVDLEQREGRIHRYKGHAVRKNVALAHGNVETAPMTDRWEAAFASASNERPDTASELVPFWVYAREGGAVIERHVPTLPLSRDAGRLVQLRGALALYRMVFGQPRQDELVRFLQERLPPTVLAAAIAELRIDLEPA
ncbi:MAG: helicase [Phycisphaerae bacterium]|nr:MAG: helicase [Phycisphaerae bacterium]